MLLIKLNNETKNKLKEGIHEILELKSFNPEKLVIVNKYLAFGINRNYSMLSVIENFNPKNPQNYNYSIIETSFIVEITKKGNSIILEYIKQGEKATIRIYPATKEVKEFFYEISKAIHLKKLEYKYPDTDFPLTSASDWECSYLWAYNPLKAHFAYLKTKDK